MEDKNSKNDNKKLIKIIQTQYPKLSKGQKLIAKYIINNYDKVAFMTASKLGDTVGVSESTVVRFANALGYSGYPKLQEGLQELIKNKLTTVQRVEMANEDYSDDSTILSKVLKSDINNIKSTLDELNEKAFEEASTRILKSRKIYILGMRSSFTVAQYLSFYLNVILDNVQLIRIDMGDPYQQIVRMNDEDILIVFSFPRYSKQSYEVAKYAKSKGAYIVSITDSSFAPVAPLSNNILLVKSNMASFVDSLVAAMSIANALIISVAMKETDDIKKYFNDLEKIWQEYVVYE